MPLNGEGSHIAVTKVTSDILRRSLHVIWLCSIFHTFSRIMGTCAFHASIFNVTEFSLVAEILALEELHDTLRDLIVQYAYRKIKNTC